MKNLWKHHKFLVVGFVAALMLATMLFVRLLADFIYWPQHQDAEISNWMTVGYVAHSYGVDKQRLTEALEIETELRRHLTLNAIADAQGIDFIDIQKALQNAIAEQRKNP